MLVGLLLAILAPAALLAQKPRTKPAPSGQVAPSALPAPAAPPAQAVAPAGPVPPLQGTAGPTPPTTPSPTLPRERLAAIDAYVAAAPASVGQSVAALAAYMAGAGPDDLSRARALFRWLAENVDYDVNSFRSGNLGDQSADAVLRSRSSVCEGYARLSEALGAAMGLQVQVVSGWSKGYGYTSGQRLEGRTNHAWNAVRIDGQWRLMDPTWGAGYLDDQMRYVRRFQEHYFLTPPESFVFDHLPQDPQWQLLARPVTADEYNELAFARPTFWLLGFRLGSHTRARITAQDRVAITLGVSQPVQMSATVLDAATDRRLEGEYALAQVGATEARVDAAFPRPGDYLVRIFAKPRGAEGSLQWVMDYRVQVARGTADAALPLAFGAFGARGVSLLEPLTGALAAGRTYRFRLRVPGALDVAVVAGGAWTHLTQSGEEWVGDVVAAAGNVNVFAKYDAGSNFTGLLRYTGR